MFLLYNIVSDTMYSVVVCVDFLGTHMTSLVCSSKLGVTKVPCKEFEEARKCGFFWLLLTNLT
jgi:hypothetical protein